MSNTNSIQAVPPRDKLHVTCESDEFSLLTVSASTTKSAKRTAFSIDSILSQKLTSSHDDNNINRSPPVNDAYRDELYHTAVISYKHGDRYANHTPHKYAPTLNEINAPAMLASSCRCEKCSGMRSCKQRDPLFSEYSAPCEITGYDLSPPVNSSRDTIGFNKYSGQDTCDVDLISNSKRRRTIFTSSQLERLEYEFQHQQYLVGQERRFLARQLGLNEIQVKVWFQNRRIKWRKFTHGNISMPDLSPM